MTKEQNPISPTACNAAGPIGKPARASGGLSPHPTPEDSATSMTTLRAASRCARPESRINGLQNVAAATKAPRQTKAALLRARLTEPGGASLAALMRATGWQAHTLRAALTGLRKAGLTLTRRREGTDTIYAIDTGGSVAAVTAKAEEQTPDATRRGPTTPDGNDCAAAAVSTAIPAGHGA